MLVVVGAALAGGSVGGEAVAEPSPQVAAGPSGEAPVGPVSRSVADVASPVIVLDSPARDDQLITTREIVVRGHVSQRTAWVQVLLQSRDEEPIVVRTAEPLALPGYRDRSQQRAVVATLPLPPGRRSGPAVLQVVAYDFRGRAVGMLLRPIQIGTVLDPTYGDGAARPPTGEDGLMGGITYGTNFSWQSDGR